MMPRWLRSLTGYLCKKDGCYGLCRKCTFDHRNRDFISAAKQLKMNNPVFTYTYEGKEYSSVLRLYRYREKEEFQEGQETEVLLDPSKPEDIYIPQPLISLLGTERLLPFLVFAAAGLWMILA